MATRKIYVSQITQGTTNPTYTYRVTKLLNLLTPAVGSVLTKREMEGYNGRNGTQIEVVEDKKKKGK